MTQRRQTSARAIASDPASSVLPRLAGGALLLGGALFLASEVRAEAHEAVTESHGYTNFGELKYPADFEHLDYVNPDAPKGGEIAIWAQGTFDSFNNYAREGVAVALNAIYYETILTGTSDDPYGTYCYLCTTLEYPESRDWVIFHLRDDVTFSDGTPMTAADVEYSFNLFLEQGIAEYRAVVETYIDSVEVIDDATIRFNFAEEAPLRDRVTFAGGTPVFSKAWFEENEIRLDESQNAPFLGTGPYVLDSFDYNRQVIIARDPDWWGADLPINQGRNNFDRIRVEYFADSTAAFEGFAAGEYTFRAENSSKEWATSYNFPAVQDGTVVLEEIPSGDIGSGQAFVFNLDHPQWQDIRVREAVEKMFNFEWSNETLFYGLYDRTDGFWQYSDLGATGTPSPEEVEILQPLVDDGLLPESILTDEVVMPTVNRATDNQPERGVFREAAALLAEAGWEVGADGMLVKDGQPMTMVILQVSPQFDRVVNPFVENLRQLGIDATLERVDYAQYVERTRTGDYDLVNSSPGQTFEPGSGLKQWFDSSTAGDSSRNLMNLRDPAIDRLLPTVIDAQSMDDMVPAIRALDRALRATRFWVPQWSKGETWVAYYDMFRHPETLPPFATGELDFWWYDEAAAQALRDQGVLN